MLHTFCVYSCEFGKKMLNCLIAFSHCNLWLTWRIFEVHEDAAIAALMIIKYL